LPDEWCNPNTIRMEERLNYLDRALAELAHTQMRTEIAMKEDTMDVVVRPIDITGPSAR
jgi:hypothetical protein